MSEIAARLAAALFSTTTINALLLIADALLYFAVLAALFRSRHRIGIGAFFCALGVMHFLETYLASVVYVALPFGIVASPGSTVLFTGKLMLLLLVYIREDAVVVRQPIYGLLIGNLLLFALAFLTRHHGADSVLANRHADFAFLDEMGALMVWGTLILFIDCILMILLYERSRAFFGSRLLVRLAVTGTLILSFDQLAFYAGLRFLTGAPLTVLFGGWISKMAAVAIYASLGAAYLRRIELPRKVKRPPRIIDVFDLLTYRERYEDLLARTGRDELTGALDRGRLEHLGRKRVEEATLAGRPLSLLIIDIDHFKSFNDRFGHAAGDVVLQRIVRIISAAVRPSDTVFRYGGEEFVVIADELTRAAAMALGERIRRRDVASHMEADVPLVTVSIGLATCAEDASDYESLFDCADRRLYLAKSAGRNCVIGETGTDAGAPKLAWAG